LLANCHIEKVDPNGKELHKVNLQVGSKLVAIVEPTEINEFS